MHLHSPNGIQIFDLTVSLSSLYIFLLSVCYQTKEWQSLAGAATGSRLFLLVKNQFDTKF